MDQSKRAEPQNVCYITMILLISITVHEMEVIHVQLLCQQLNTVT